MKNVLMSGSPHIKDDLSTSQIMNHVVFALLPAAAVSIVFFGLGAVHVMLVAIASCLIVEYVIQKLLLKVETTLSDGSALVTGLLLSFNLPSSIPWWMVMIGSFVAMAIGKLSYGGLGQNPFNPALVGRVFLLISFPVEMTSWPKPQLLNFKTFDVVTGATPLGLLKEGVKQGESVSSLMQEIPNQLSLFLGNMGGSLGEVSALALLLGGIFLLFKRIISWHIPVSFLLSMSVITGATWMIDPARYADPLFHIITGGAILGAFFMATDMVTSPMTGKGMIIFGIGCGILTAVILIWGIYPEGVSFAILLMNAFVPIINQYCRPPRFGVQPT